MKEADNGRETENSMSHTELDPNPVAVFLPFDQPPVVSFSRLLDHQKTRSPAPRFWILKFREADGPEHPEECVTTMRQHKVHSLTQYTHSVSTLSEYTH